MVSAILIPRIDGTPVTETSVAPLLSRELATWMRRRDRVNGDTCGERPQTGSLFKEILGVDEFGIGQAGKYSNGESDRRNGSFKTNEKPALIPCDYLLSSQLRDVITTAALDLSTLCFLLFLQLDDHFFYLGCVLQALCFFQVQLKLPPRLAKSFTFVIKPGEV